MSTVVSSSEVRRNWSDFLTRASYGKERIRIERSQKVAVGIVPVEDVDLLEALDDFIDILDAREAAADARKNGTIPWDEFRRELRA